MNHPLLRWSIGPDVQVAFSIAADGDMRERRSRAAWLQGLGIERCAVVRQVHGTVIRDGDASPDEPLADADADGLVTTRAIAIGVFGADCPGLCLVATDAMAVAHCGWRGTAAGMVARTVDALAARSRQPPLLWRALIGPGIAAAGYEVDAPVLDGRRWPASALQQRPHGRALLDLAEAIACDLADAGVVDIQRTGVDTATDPRLHSYRRGGAKLAQLLVAWRTTGDQARSGTRSPSTSST